jgi:LuxR family maltose regulon positive regulatory protein
VGTSPEQQLALGLEDDRRARVGPTFGLVESKLRPPSARPGIVARTALVERLLASPAAPVICVIAPPGYGKSTLLAQWSERLGRRVGWVSVDRRDNDPVVLLTYIAAALDRVGPIDSGVFQALTAPGVSVAGTAVPRFVSAVSTMTDPVALVLDHVELLENPACLDAVAELALALPAGSRLALASRRTPAFPVALLRAQGQLMEVGVEELAMDAREASALLEAADVELSDAEMTELAVRTEGWPVGLYLAALALKAGGSPGGSGLSFTGDDRFIADYLHAELLAQLPAERVTFLTRTAVLERMCGPLCDVVLDTTGSGEVLASLQGSNLLLVALDRRREWCRYHHLFGELLLAELERREPDLVPELHGRAASWYEANGLPEVAIDHAQATGDADRVARLVAALAQPIYAAGRVDTVRQWLAWLEERGLVERYPPVAVLGAWLQALVGRPAGALRWADAAERRPTVAAWAVGTQAPADATTMESDQALLRALLCRDDVNRMRADAHTALASSSSASWRATALVLEGVADMLAGEADRADPILADAVEVGTDASAWPATSTGLAERCLLAIQRGDWDQAEVLAGQALGIVQARRLDDYIMSALVHGVAARTALHRGDLVGARERVARAARLRPLLTHAIPWLAVQTLLELGQAYLALDDLAGARAVLRQARDILQLRPNLGILPAQVQELRSGLDTARRAAAGASSLTAAELRLLPLLATHLTFREIGQRLCLSHNTVKTQAISIYRKLGASSRGQAVQRVQETGLLTG